MLLVELDQIFIENNKYIQVAYDKFPDFFFCIGTFIDSTLMKL